MLKTIGFYGVICVCPVCTRSANILQTERKSNKNLSKSMRKTLCGGSSKNRSKSTVWGANMPPKMDPGGFQKRVHKTVTAKNASWGAPRAPPDDFGAIFLPHRYPRIIRGLSGTPNFAHLGPWERTIIKEIDLTQLKHRIRHARWPGEFLDSSRFSASISLIFDEKY